MSYDFLLKYLVLSTKFVSLLRIILLLVSVKIKGEACFQFNNHSLPWS